MRIEQTLYASQTGCAALQFTGSCSRSRDNRDQFEYCTRCLVLLVPDCSSSIIRSHLFSNCDFPHINPNTVFVNLTRMHSVNRYYNTALLNFTARKPAIAWIKHLCLTFKFSQETLHLSVAMFDATLSLYQMSEDQLRLLAFLTVYLAAKTAENERKLPNLKDVVAYFQNEFSVEDFATYEMKIVQLFNWNLNIRTPLTFVNFFFARGIVSSDDLHSNESLISGQRFVGRIESRAVELLDVSLECYKYYYYTSIAVAAAAVAASRKQFGLNPWPRHMEYLTLIPWDKIAECVECLCMEFDGRMEVEKTCSSPTSSTEPSQTELPTEKVQTPVKQSKPVNVSTTAKKQGTEKKLSSKKQQATTKKLMDDETTRPKAVNSVSVSLFSIRETQRSLIMEHKAHPVTATKKRTLGSELIAQKSVKFGKGG